MFQNKNHSLTKLQALLTMNLLLFSINFYYCTIHTFDTFFSLLIEKIPLLLCLKLPKNMLFTLQGFFIGATTY